jgi:hypothetical protein
MEGKKPEIKKMLEQLNDFFLNSNENETQENTQPKQQNPESHQFYRA